jgi:5'-nucleotidase
MKTLRIYVDMDDTLCDCTTAYKEARLRSPEMRYPQATHGFFRNLVPIKDAVAGVDALKRAGHDVWILTRPSTMNRLCYTEKADWVYKHLGQEWVDKLILCPDKSLLKGDVLIDDTLWPAFEGTQIVFKDGGFAPWPSVVYEVYLIAKK